MVNELERFVRPLTQPYSYVFNGESGYLDHALASASLDPQVAGATEWHVNADELSHDRLQPRQQERRRRGPDHRRRLARFRPRSGGREPEPA
ncbi:hypothetical protein LP420_07960 [Massilia sp. B-10]|nr:hypothetical protein LP420_07960 [Massilia sp. B-10]